MGISSVIGGALWLWANREAIEFRPTGVKAAFARNWFLSRWTTATQIGEVVRIQMFPWLLAVALNEHTVGIYAACAAIATLSGPLQIAVSNILLPQFAAAEEQKRLADADRLMWQATAWMTLVMALFTLAVGSVSGSIVPRLYGPEFVGTQWPLLLLLVAQLISAASMPAARALVALQRPDLDFVCQLAGIVLNLAAGVPLVLEWGITGAAWSSVLAAVTKAALTAVFYTRELRARSTSDAESVSVPRFAESMQPAMATSWREEP
jgi:O-antigen/teichoic acid export membrane protein